MPKILHEYDFIGQHYSLIQKDDGTKIEIQGKDPIAILSTMPADLPPQSPLEKTLMDFSDDELTLEIDRRASLERIPETGILCKIYNWTSTKLSAAWAYITGKG
jgi:hypothetical protein